MNKTELFALMSKYNPLPHEELAKAPLEDVVMHNIRFAYTQAQKFAKRYPGLDDDEIIEAMLLGLTHAANKWDSSKSKFTPYITQWVRLIIKISANENQSNINKNSMYIWKTHKINAFVSKYTEEFKKEPTTQEIMDATGFPETTVYNVFNLGIKSINGLDTKIEGNDSYNLHDIIGDKTPDPLEQLQTADLSYIMNQLISDLPSIEQKIVIARWYNKEKYYDIADKLDISYQQIKKIEKTAMSKIKHEFLSIDKEFSFGNI